MLPSRCASTSTMTFCPALPVNLVSTVAAAGDGAVQRDRQLVDARRSGRCGSAIDADHDRQADAAVGHDAQVVIARRRRRRRA